MIGRIGMTVLLGLRLGSAVSRGEASVANSGVAQGAGDPVVLEIERQIEAVVSQDSEQTTTLELRRMLEMVKHQFAVLDLSRSMVQRHRAHEIYKALQSSNRVEPEHLRSPLMAPSKVLDQHQVGPGVKRPRVEDALSVWRHGKTDLTGRTESD